MYSLGITSRKRQYRKEEEGESESFVLKDPSHGKAGTVHETTSSFLLN